MKAIAQPLVPEGVFEPDGRYFDTPTYGLAPAASFDAVVEAAQRWRSGRASMAEYDEAVAKSRQLFAGIVGVDPARVAIGANVSSLVGPVAASLAPGSRVLVPEGEFTSLLFPLLVNRGLEVRTVTFADLATSLDESVDVVAFSLVQSSNGAVADIERVVGAAHRVGAVTLVDATHAAGWFRFDPLLFDFVFVAAYKWLMCPRGVAFMVDNSDTDVPAINAGWYSGDDPWESIYGGPLRLADSARRFDTSPAWMAWVGAVPSLQLIAFLGVDRIHDHNVALANSIRDGLGMKASNSAIVTVSTSDPTPLTQAGIKTAMRASAVRVGCHIHNSSADVDALLEVLSEITP
ncbi:MAG TPA: aminotransferase class V-fold PLP-dependent enzyme [Acidimicrobiia bacterium]|nr:aminotransferase class V-fold PLP-dependent enzyme [Acidimicrobiia bacterium]